jgi:uncharacterized damage-inducible protein DinB
MKLQKMLFVPAMFLALAVSVFPAQAEEAASGFHADVIANLDATGQKLIALAEATPAELFSWKPNVAVRTVSEVYVHVVGTNFLLPVALGAAPPAGVEPGPNAFALMAEWEKNITAKDDVIAKLKESLEYAKKAIASIQDLDTEVQLFGPPQSKRAYLLILLTHAHEHLGQSIAYARSFGVAPPWSRPLPSPVKAQAEDHEHGDEGHKKDGH